MVQRSARTGTPRKPVTTKLADDLRSQLEAAAEANSRTLGSEIEHRLRASFSGQDQRAMMREVVAEALTEHEAKAAEKMAERRRKILAQWSPEEMAALGPRPSVINA